MKTIRFKNFIIVLTSLCIISLGVIVYYNTRNNSNGTNDILEEPNIQYNIPNTVSALYINTVDTIDQLIDEAQIIIMGEVINQREHEAGLSIISEVKVKEIYLGEVENDVIEVLQLKGENVVKDDKAYVLALKRQGDIYNQYFVLGGTQGIFEIHDNKLEVLDTILKDDMEKYYTNQVDEEPLFELDILLEKINKSKEE